MVEAHSDLPQPADKPSKQLRKDMPSRRIRFERWSRLGCFPMMLLACVAAMLLAALIAWSNQPRYGVFNFARAYTDFFFISLVILAVIQTTAIWIIGIRAARMGSQAVRGGRASFRPRMHLIRQRLQVPTMAILLARGFAVVLVAVSIIIVLRDSSALIQFNPVWEGVRLLEAIWDIDPFFVIVVTGAVLLHFIIGPWLRVRYSTMLGALAATFTRKPFERASLAATARLGVGLLLGLALLWGTVLAFTVVLLATDPLLSSPGLSVVNERLILIERFSWPRVGSVTRAVYVMSVALTIIPIYMAGQAVFATLYALLTRRRLKKIHG